MKTDFRIATSKVDKQNERISIDAFNVTNPNTDSVIVRKDFEGESLGTLLSLRTEGEYLVAEITTNEKISKKGVGIGFISKKSYQEGDIRVHDEIELLEISFTDNPVHDALIIDSY